MSIEVRDQATPENLEKLLNLLPEPDYAEVKLFGKWDYSAIYSQAKEINSELELCIEESKFKILKPTKKIILDIYKKSYNPYNPENAEESYAKTKNKRVFIEKIKWFNLLPNGSIELDPFSLNIKYKGKEPEFVLKLKEKFKTYTQISIDISE